MFANDYLNKNQFQPESDHPVDPGTCIIVVIPCYIEPDILQTLDSLSKTNLPGCGVEVIVAINHSESAPVTEKAFNAKTYDEISVWLKSHPDIAFQVIPLGPVNLPEKWAGAGLARKRGMDEAVHRFNSIQKPDGIIVSLDADTLVEENYLTEIIRHYQDHPGHVGATISFSHQKEGLISKNSEGIELYEKYLHYYKRALDYVGYPNSMFTIGSAFTVKAQAYVKRGGMSRRKAGEDFYFLQNLAQMGTVGEINSTCVHPSARPSMRVPFGTGASITRWLEGTEDLTRTYDFRAFSDLKKFFDQKEHLFRINETAFHVYMNDLPRGVREFIIEDDFRIEIDDLNRNCSVLPVFRERFFQKFNAFKILKYLNFVHNGFYTESPLDLQIDLLNNAISSLNKS